ncbi:DUF803-domain-containing protein [Mollisia scopiformis]|uniref:DUF803-domain-containing protein n=1 Tax=Mollisia scopiformis TaxID=149040 RepID=A0A194WZE0_MOLSC|nr:DUF803-domain-containing protein [Mollisia scopiformis]KUJ12972.1 DUF803-domain-containing protein [Mollisia scopiformis]
MFLSTSILDAATTTVLTPPSLISATPFANFGSPVYELEDGDSQLQRWSSLIGIITAIIGNILISFALNIQRYAHIRLHEEQSHRREKLKSIPKSAGGYGTTGTNGHVTEVNGQNGEEADNTLQSSFSSRSTGCGDEDHKEEVTYLRSPYWWGGIVLMTIGEAGNFLAYGFAPASIVSPLGVVALISNCVIAPIMLKEQFRMRDFWGVVVAVAGAVTVVLSAKQEEKKLGPHEIWGAITTLEFEVYLAVTIFLIVVLMWASPKYGNRTILIDLGLVGLFGGYTALSTKGVASMLSSTLWRALTTPVTYALLLVLVGTAVMQVRYVNKSLQRFDSTQVIPVQFVMFTLSVIIGSAILYRDFEKTTPERVVKFIGGCLLTFFGVFLITSGRPNRDEEDEESDEEGEERIGLLNQEHNAEENDPQGTLRRYSSARPLVQNGGDAANDEESISTRRSSRVSFADTTSRPKTPQRFSNSSAQPSARVVPPEGAPENAPLLSNPWLNSSDDFLYAARHPGLPTTTSSPVLPTEAQTSTESLRPPSGPSRTISQGPVHTHPNHQTGPTPPQGDRPMTPARHSIARMLPGPLLSPLSGGLAAVVADSIRRDSSIRRSFRRPRLGLRRTKSGSHRYSQATDGEDDEAVETPTKDDDGEPDYSKSLGTERQTEWSRLTRARSLSNTLGDLFGRGKRQKLDRPNTAGEDEEAGPSGS